MRGDGLRVIIYSDYDSEPVSYLYKFFRKFRLPLCYFCGLGGSPIVYYKR